MHRSIVPGTIKFWVLSVLNCSTARVIGLRGRCGVGLTADREQVRRAQPVLRLSYGVRGISHRPSCARQTLDGLDSRDGTTVHTIIADVLSADCPRGRYGETPRNK